MLKDLYLEHVKISYNSKIRQITELKNGPNIWIDTTHKKIYKWLLSTWKDNQHVKSSRKYTLKQYNTTTLPLESPKWKRLTMLGIDK